MRHRDGLPQRDLRRITCQWGEHRMRHAALVPLFRADYRVFGLMGLDLGRPPVWYPDFPINVQPRGLLFKDAVAERPPPLDTLPADHFAGAFYHDPWRALAPMLAATPGAPPLRGAGNLARRTVLGRPVLDVIYELALHRVRAFRVQRRLWRTVVWPVLRLPSLREALDPAPRDTGDEAAIFGQELPASPREAPAQGEGLLDRWLRRVIEAAAAPPPGRESGQEPSGGSEQRGPRR